MESMKMLVNESNVDNLSYDLRSGDGRFVCYTRLVGETWVLGVTDGVDVWRTAFTVAELDDLREVAEIKTIDSYLGRFRLSFTSGEITVGKEGYKLYLKVGHGAKSLDFELFEAKAVERKSEIQTLLFYMSDKVSELSVKLNQANTRLDNIKQDPGGSTSVFELESKKSQAKPVAKKAGMSILNPTSKKRKAAQGIVFD